MKKVFATCKGCREHNKPRQFGLIHGIDEVGQFRSFGWF